MRNQAPVLRPAGHEGVPPRTRLIVAGAQVCVIVALGWYGTTPASDATATKIDWMFVGFAITIPCALAVSSWIGWMVQRRSRPKAPRAIGLVATVAQWLTLGLLVLSLVIAPLAVFGEVAFGPMG